MRQPPGDFTGHTRLPFTVSSLIDHGHRETDLLLVMPLWPHDANLFLSLLHHRLLHLIDTGQRLGQQTLYLQLDNCVRENKNKVVFAYLSYLVRVGGTCAILVVILLLFTFIFCSIQRHLCELSCCGTHT